MQGAETEGRGRRLQAERARLLAFAEKLRAERERRNLTQESLAEIANVHRTHIGALELGLREPHLTMLLILADALRVPPGILLKGLFVSKERKAPNPLQEPASHFKRLSSR